MVKNQEKYFIPTLKTVKNRYKSGRVSPGGGGGGRGWIYVVNQYSLHFYLYSYPWLSLKNKLYVSSCRTRLFFGACLIWFSKIQACDFFLLIFFFSFFMNWLVKIYMKRHDRHNKTLWTTNFFNSVFCLVSRSSKYQVPYFILNKVMTNSNLKCLLLREKKINKKNAFRSGFPICHKLWDIEFFFFFSLKYQL